MATWARAVLYGILSWLLPFAVSFFLFPLKQANLPLFCGLMNLIVLITAGVLLVNYFRWRVVSLSEAALVGLLWLAMNLIFDYPMFVYGPMKMSAASYYSEIGILYATFPVFAMLSAQIACHAGPAARHPRRSA